MKKLRILCIGYVLCCITNRSLSQNVITVKHVDDFIISANGTNAVWNQTSWNILTQRTNKELQKAGWPVDTNNVSTLTYDTRFKILYSENGIYCLYHCEDSVITATIQQDFGRLFDEDVIEAFFWPDTTRRIYFEYEVSPLNHELPVIVFNNKNGFGDWLPFDYKGDRKTQHAVHVEKKNTGNRFVWTAEFFIPFKLLNSLQNVPPKSGTTWRANFYRIDYDSQRLYSSWQLTRRGFHDPEKFGVLLFE